ncbi:MAG: zinc-dependent metalloprotease [Myxococcota bacterium]
MRTLSIALVGALAVLSGCAQDVGEIDRTQPNLLPKAMFAGDWFVRQTVVDVPETSTFSFVGDTGDMELINWVFEENFLIGYRAYEKVPGADPAADPERTTFGDVIVREGLQEGRNPDDFQGQPIVAYPISHVDVFRDYNPRTGEQTNTLREDTQDRPWFEREFVRVDWNNPQIANWFFKSTPNSDDAVLQLYGQATEGGPDAFRVCHDGDEVCTDGRFSDASEHGDPYYFDFTERMAVSPDIFDCILDLNNVIAGDCTAQEVKVRTSFLKVDPEAEAEFIPVVYSDQRQGEFGFFRTERKSYDRQRGVLNEGLIFLANVHQIWTNTLDANGERIVDAAGNPDFSQYTLKPVVYTLSANYPESLRPVTDEIVAEYDRSFKEAAAARLGFNIEQVTAKIQNDTGGTCLFCMEENPEGEFRIGDLRKSFIYWVDHPQLASPLGYGPSSGHPETGRIVAGMAYVYGAAVDTYAQTAADMVNLINGDLTDEDILGEEYILNQVAARRAPTDPRSLARIDRIDGAENPIEEMLGLNFDRVESLLGAPDQNGNTWVDLDNLQESRFGWDNARLNRVRGTEMEAMMINDEVLRAHAPLLAAQGYQDFNIEALTPELIETVSPLNIGRGQVDERVALKRLRAQENNIWLADFTDPTIIGLAREAKDAGLTGLDLWQYLREQIYKGVQLHEIGHTIGLRHNFGGSADPLNYFSEYWDSRRITLDRVPTSLGEALRSSCQVRDATNAATCDQQDLEKMREYQYTSIMDYGAKFNSDFHGLGRYDDAAIAAGYADMVQVFEDNVTAAMVETDVDFMRTIGSFRNPLFGMSGDFLHYTQIPGLFSSTGDIDEGIAAMQQRRYVPRETFDFSDEATGPLRVPYYACYDEYRDSTAQCHTWDEGADPYEITENWIRTYREYYVINNLARDRLGFNPSNVGARAESRYFAPMINMYQHWIFDFRQDGSLREAVQTQAMVNGFQLLSEVMATPRYGSYVMGEPPLGSTTGTTGEYQWRRYDMGDGEIDIPQGVGRRTFTRFDTDTGYNFFNFVSESGHFFERFAAIRAITASDASVIGIGAGDAQNFLTYRIPLYLVFENQINEMFGGIIRDDNAIFAPRWNNGEFVYRDWNSTAQPIGTPIDGNLSFTDWFYTALFGSAFLSSNFDLGFVQRMQVALAGSGEEIDIAPNFEEVRLEDPVSGRVYIAYRDPARANEGWVAADKIDQINQLIADGAQDFQITREVNDLEIYRALYNIFGMSPI